MSKITLNGIDYAGGSSGGSGGHTIIDQSGNDMPSRTGLQFIGASVADDSVNNKTVVTITGGGGGGVSNFTETVLATASSFSDMTVDFSTAYDAFIFYANDATFQKAESYFFTRSEITDAINNNFAISLYPFGNGGICQYSITRSGLTKLNNSAGFFIYKIVGLNFGSTPHIYSTNEQVIGTWIDGKPVYQRTWTGTKNNNSDEAVISDLSNVDVLVDSRVTFKGNTGSQIVQYYRDTNDRARIWLDGGDLKVHMDSGNSYPILPITWYITLQYTKTTD